MRLQAPTRFAAPTAADHGAATPWAPTGPAAVPLAAAAVLIVGRLYVVPILGEFASAWEAGTSRTAWTVTAFGFACATGLLVFGTDADRVGRRRVLLSGLVAASFATAAVAGLGPQPAGAAAGALLGAGMLTAPAARRIRRRQA
ncbi:hypothetical protein [Glycomyces tritici]|uniref:MFS transporter n=1 Tax=Glycomyces tritici TaxID=2665176 RepID=A0ABT7YLP1_9ACTN|nr:hypothetical protein [Glycomyces tritici]MDN3239562.1 hypothetical protein [Glycomyces tritici]